MKRMKRVTIYDVAQEADVAPSTVSRAFSNSARVNSLTREHVYQIAKELGFRPNTLRALPSRQLRTIALITSDITNPHYFEVIRGAERRAAAAGLLLILINSEDQAQVEARQLSAVGHSVDGFVLASSRLTDDQLREFGREHTIALVSREVDGLASVTIDPEQGARQLVEHLASLGHKSILYLEGPKQSWIRIHRWKAIVTAARQLGIHASRLGPFPATYHGGWAAADAAIAHHAIAVIAHNDLLAVGVMRRLREHGRAVPEDMSVAGFDNIPEAEWCATPLTTVAGPHEDVGRFAVELCLENSRLGVGRPTPRQIRLLSQIVIRKSTGPPLGSKLLHR